MIASLVSELDPHGPARPLEDEDVFVAPAHAHLDPAGGEPLLVCQDLRYAYLERFVALDGVSLEIRSGEKVALLGANGCGKSTLLKILDGLLFPDGGSYRAFGQPVTEDDLEDEQFSMGFRSRVGFIFQNSDAQVFSPTVREDVAFGPLQLGWSRDKVGSPDRRRAVDARDS